MLAAASADAEAWLENEAAVADVVLGPRADLAYSKNGLLLACSSADTLSKIQLGAEQ